MKKERNEAVEQLFFKLWNNYFSLQLMMTTTQDRTSVTCVRSARSWDAAVDDAYQIRNSSWEVIAINFGILCMTNLVSVHFLSLDKCMYSVLVRQ